jgi:branched-chain amino acid transport system permease protein
MGVNLTRYKLLGFGLSAAVAGIGGAFYPMVIGRVAFQPFSFFYSLQFAAFAVLMGIRFVPSALIGGIFMAVIPELLTKIGPAVGGLIGRPELEIRYDWFNLILGIILVFQIIGEPQGIYGGAAERIGHLFRKRIGKPPLEPIKVVTS